MSMAADIASLELIAAVHQITNLDQSAYEHVVHRLHQQVAHFEWVGLYMEENSQFVLKASAGDQSPESIARKSILQVPITYASEPVLGRIMVTSKVAVAFDESDFTSLTALATELGKKIEQTQTNQ
jgi:putative methionine-R-sulfoxide reductase with GAF domain